MSEENRIQVGKATHIHLKTKIPLFDEINFHFVITEDIVEVHKLLGISHTEHCARVGGECHMDDDAFDVYVIIQHSCLTHEWIGHEFLHAVCCVADRVGIGSSEDADETYARIAGFLHKWGYKKLDKYGLKVGHVQSK